jgi:hypothetical protein
MQSFKYLNFILTALTILMALQLWVVWVDGPAEDGQPLGLASPAYAAGIPNAGQQRLQMIQELKSLSKEIRALNMLFRTGQAKVKVEGLKDKNH